MMPSSFSENPDVRPTNGMEAKPTRWLAAILLIAYSVILIRIVVFKAVPTLSVGHLRLRIAGPHTGPANFVPLRTIAPQLIGRGNHLINIVNLVGNIIPFMPIGYLAPLVGRFNSWRGAIALGAFAGLACEVMEVVYQVGIFDVDDVLLNAFGVVLGYGAFALFDRRARSVLAL
jgi:glycopeptide antibiotics resistance protein